MTSDKQLITEPDSCGDVLVLEMSPVEPKLINFIMWCGVEEVEMGAVAVSIADATAIRDFLTDWLVAVNS